MKTFLNNKYTSFTVMVISILLVIFSTEACKSSKIVKPLDTDTLYTNTESQNISFEIQFTKGAEHNHPLMAIWIEDMDGKYIETLYVAESIAKGVFRHGNSSSGRWLPGAVRRPAALPVWSHSRGVKESDGLFVPTENTPMVDAVTGETPSGNFILIAKAVNALPDNINMFFEINQPWDWNEYWTNNKYPDDEHYKTSCQPALVYQVEMHVRDTTEYTFDLVGRSSHNGSDGNIYKDLETITTAKNITKELRVELK